MKARRILSALLLMATVSCATFAPGSDPVVVRAQDVLNNSIVLYDATMRFHYAHSQQEPPEVYAALEKLRPAFPKAWRGFQAAVVAYQASQTRDRAGLRAAGLQFLDEVSALGPRDWAASIGLIRQAFEEATR